jgi:hypothetical protein
VKRDLTFLDPYVTKIEHLDPGAIYDLPEFKVSNGIPIG